MSGDKPKKPQLRRVPKILADELDATISNLRRHLPAEMAIDMLARHRRNSTRLIAAWGIGTWKSGDIDNTPVAGLEPIPFEYLYDIARLDDAWQKYWKYQNGGAADYVSAPVATEINRIRAQGKRSGRSKKYPQEEIIA